MKRYFIILIIIVISISVLFLYRYIAKHEAIQCVLAWGRLAPFPKNISDFEIKSSGNPFTRRFHCSFIARKGDLTRWVIASPGFKDSFIVKPSNVIQTFIRDGGRCDTVLPHKGITYIITPGDGGNSAEVEIDYNTGKVTIDVGWS